MDAPAHTHSPYRSPVDRTADHHRNRHDRPQRTHDGAQYHGNHDYDYDNNSDDYAAPNLLYRTTANHPADNAASAHVPHHRAHHNGLVAGTITGGRKPESG